MTTSGVAPPARADAEGAPRVCCRSPPNRDSRRSIAHSVKRLHARSAARRIGLGAGRPARARRGQRRARVPAGGLRAPDARHRGRRRPHAAAGAHPGADAGDPRRRRSARCRSPNGHDLVTRRSRTRWATSSRAWATTCRSRCWPASSRGIAANVAARHLNAGLLQPPPRLGAGTPIGSGSAAGNPVDHGGPRLRGVSAGQRGWHDAQRCRVATDATAAAWPPCAPGLPESCPGMARTGSCAGRPRPV